MPAFIFLEIMDRDLNLLFSEISRVVQGVYQGLPTHLTIRGPYSAKTSAAASVRRCREAMKHDVLRIANVGRFSNVGEEVVFFRVDSSNLKKVWWKPDYPTAKFGFNPHISIYRGKDGEFADVIEKFFRHENLELMCAEFRIVSAVSRQGEMLVPPPPMTRFPFHEVLRGSIRPNMLSRLELVVSRYRRNSAMLDSGV